MGLLESIQGFFQDVKEAGTSFLVERFVAHRIQPYGRMISLSIDSKNSRIRLEVLPKGETEAISINIEEYQLINANGSLQIVIKQASASREWIDALLKDFATGKTIPLPDKYAHMIKTIL